jgi:hypothetical protein
MLTMALVLTALVETVKVAVMAPAGTVTLAGTLATAELLLESETTAPPGGAARPSVTLPVAGFPPIRPFGFKLRRSGWTTMTCADLVRSSKVPEIVTHR